MRRLRSDLTAVALLGLWCSGCGNVPTNPIVAVDKWHSDFGIVHPGQQLDARFQIRNTGTGILQLQRPQSSCGCAPAKLDRFEVPPNEWATLSVSTQSMNHPGSLNHLISLKSNDPQQPQLSFTLSAKVDWSIDVSPPRILISRLLLGKEVTRPVTVYRKDHRPFLIEAIENPSPRIHVRQLAVAEAECTYEVIVKSNQLGKFDDLIQFVTNDPERPRLELPVSMEIISDDSISPERIVLGRRPTGYKHTVVLTATLSDSTNELIDITSDNTSWNIESWDCTDIGPGEKRIEVTVKAPETEGYHANTLNLKWRIPVSGSLVRLSCLTSKPGQPASPSGS